jgi:hypothetical protein
MADPVEKVVFAISTDDLDDLENGQWGIETTLDAESGIRSFGYRDAEGALHRMLCKDAVANVSSVAASGAVTSASGVSSFDQLTVSDTLESGAGRRKNITRIVGEDCVLFTYLLQATDHHVLINTDAASAFQVQLPPGIHGTEYFIYCTGAAPYDMYLTADSCERLFGRITAATIPPGVVHIIYDSVDGWVGGFSAIPETPI